MCYPKEFILKMLLASSVFGFLSCSAVAQRVELFGGYQFTHLQPSFNAHGWNASLTGNFKHILGITGDFSGAYENSVTAYTFTGGPALQARLPVVQPFVHALFGGMRLSGFGVSTCSMAQLGTSPAIGIR